MSKNQVRAVSLFFLSMLAGAAACATPRAGRPAGPSVGIGAGYEIGPQDAESAAPNTASVRGRLPSGLAFEPRVVLSRTTTEIFGDEETTTGLGASATVRVPLGGRGRADLLALGIAAVAHESVEDEPDEEAVTATNVTVGWGLAVDYWLDPSWVVSMSFLNPVVVYASQDDNGDPSVLSYGLVMSPTVLAMVHLNY
jgi:hypothetical protein